MRLISISVLTISMTVVWSPASAQTRFGLAAGDWQVAHRWLQTNCLAPSAQPFLDDLRRRRAALQPAFLRAIDEGPTADEIAAVRTAAAARYRERRQSLQRPEIREALPPERLAALQQTSEDRFVAGEVDAFTNGWKSNAMAALAVVGDDSAMARLQTYARGDSPALAAAARAALAYRQSNP
jgi:hypothetical protein